MNKPINWLLAIIGLACLGLAIYYWVTPAESLPTWMPGYAAGSSVVHLKHGLAALILAVAAGLLLWFNSGSKGSSPLPQPPTSPPNAG